MAKKGENSKQKLAQDILNLYACKAFVQDKNIYVNFTENGETVQLKISVTMPKVPIGGDEEEKKDFDWSDPSSSEETTLSKQDAIIPEEELETLRAMLDKLNL